MVLGRAIEAAGWTSKRTETATCGRGGCRRDGPGTDRRRRRARTLIRCPDGGAFDGPLGVVSAFAAIDVVRERGVVPCRFPSAWPPSPTRRGARFWCCMRRLPAVHRCVERREGSRAAGRTRHDARRGDDEGGAATPSVSALIRSWPIASVSSSNCTSSRAARWIWSTLRYPIASAIWPHGRWQFTFCGEANHAGYDPSRRPPRSDARLRVVGALRAGRGRRARRRCDLRQGHRRTQRGQRDSVGGSRVAGRQGGGRGNADVPGRERSRRRRSEHAALDSVSLDVDRRIDHPDSAVPGRAARTTARRRSARLGDIPVLPTAAGHDAGILSALVPTAMLFVRNPTGVSHSPEEHAEIGRLQSGCDGPRRRHGRLDLLMSDLDSDDLVVRTRVARRRHRRRRSSRSPWTTAGSPSIRTDAAPDPGSRRLHGLVIPGIANAHSHAFHRALRGAHATRSRGRSGPGVT